MNAVVKQASFPTATELEGEEQYGNRRILSGPGGAHEAPAKTRDKLCLLDSGELLCVPDSRLDEDVFAYEHDLKRAGVPHKIVLTSLQTIRVLYERAATSERGAPRAVNTSTMQKRALGIIADAARVNASDIHIIRRGDLAVIRRRVNGLMEQVSDLPGDDGQELQASIYASMCADSSEFFKPDEPQDGRLKPEFVTASGLFGARIATYPTRGGPMMVIRLLHGRDERRTLIDLGYLPEQLALIERLTKKVSGINIFSGPTGSGKSTSLQVLFEQLIDYFEHKINPITIENPCEYEIRGANQTPLLKDGSWGRAVKSMMRMDPDVLMVGEIRDHDSAAAAFDLALAGHGIWSTVHANDAATILQRLSRFGLESSEWGDHTVLTGLINQCLVPTLCPHCKVPFTAEAMGPADVDVAERVARVCNRNAVFIAGDGCQACRFTGVAGRAVIAEVIAPDLHFMRLFRDTGKAEAVAYWRKELGGISKLQHLIRRINQGLVDPRHGENEVGLLDEEGAHPPLRIAQ